MIAIPDFYQIFWKWSVKVDFYKYVGMRSGWQSETNLNILVSTIHPPWSSALFLMQISNIWILNISQIFIVQCNQYLLARTTLMDWRIIGRSHQLTWRREILGGEGEKYLEGKARNTWRRRRWKFILNKKKEAISRPVRGPSLVYKDIFQWIYWWYILLYVAVHI